MKDNKQSFIKIMALFAVITISVIALFVGIAIDNLYVALASAATYGFSTLHLKEK